MRRFVAFMLGLAVALSGPLASASAGSAKCGGPTHRPAASEHDLDGMVACCGTRANAIDDAFRDACAAANPATVERLDGLHAAQGGWRALHAAIWPIRTTPTVVEEAALAAAARPSLIVIGDRDAFLSVEAAAALRRALPRSQLAAIPRGRHPVFRDRPDLFDALVLDFVKGLP